MAASNAVFVDTSGWIAVLNSDDQLHASATQLLQQFGTLNRRLVTTDWVLAEAGNGLARNPIRHRFVQAIRSILGSPGLQLVRVDANLFDQAMDVYDQAQDKSWGLVDCASFVIMRSEGLTDSLTADHHFQQAGFHALLKRP